MTARTGGDSAARGPRWRREDGVALVTVLGLSFVLVVALTAAARYAVNTMPQVRDHEDWNAALAAAEAAVDDALYRLNQNPNYWAVPDPDNAALTGWRDVPGVGGDARYHYRLDASQVARTGAVDVIATGWVGDQQRTIDVRLRRDGFLDYIYFTEFEASDPFAMTTNVDQRAYLDSYCAVHHPHRDTRDVSNVTGRGGCSTIRFAPGDVLTGPTRSHDALLIRSGPQGPHFRGRVFTGWNWEAAGSSHPYLRDAGSTHEPVFEQGVEYRARFAMPETSRKLADRARESGCHYEGPTSIRFHVAGIRPQMTVVSPLTHPSDVNPGCGTGTTPNGTWSGGIRSTVDLKHGEVLYVADSERSVSGHPLQMPRPNDNVNTFSATAGDAFVYGEVQGQVTVAAENDVVVVWDLVYRDRSENSSDLVGLIADNNVWVYHPVRHLGGGNYQNLPVAHKNLPPFRLDAGNPFPGVIGGGTTYPGARLWEDPEIHAAILALNRSFGVQAFNRGAPFTSGDLTVHGAIAQRWRGPVARANASGALASGYLKDYVYDWRLQYLTPPYFLEPEMSPWERRRWAEVQRPETCADDQAPIDDGCLPTT